MHPPGIAQSHATSSLFADASIPELGSSSLESVQPSRQAQSELNWVVTSSTIPHVRGQRRVNLGRVKSTPGHTGPSNAKTTNKAQCSAIWIDFTGPECVGERCAQPLHPPGGVGGAVRGQPIIIQDTVSLTLMLIDLKFVELSQGEKCQTGAP